MEAGKSETQTGTPLMGTPRDEYEQKGQSMIKVSAKPFDQSPPSYEEQALLHALREELHDVLLMAPLQHQPENVSDWKLLRFLRGHNDSQVTFWMLKCSGNTKVFCKIMKDFRFGNSRYNTSIKYWFNSYQMHNLWFKF